MAFESLQSFLMWLGLTDKVEAGACKKNIQRLMDNMTIFKIFCETQWDNWNQSTGLGFFISQTCPRAATNDDERLYCEILMWWPHHKVPEIVKTVCFRNLS